MDRASQIRTGTSAIRGEPQITIKSRGAMPALHENPFAVLTAVVAPAILTNACSVLSLGTANRMARVVDRTRVVIAARAALAAGSPDYREYSRQLDRLALR